MVRSRSNDVKGGEPGAEHDANVLFDTWRLSRAVGALLDAVLAPGGLTADEFGVYSVLAGASGITPTELARWMAAPPSTVSSYVTRFERRGHVERVANPGDQRSYLIRLTPAGRRAHTQASAGVAPTLARVLAALGDQEAAVRAALRSLLAAVESARTPDVTRS
jgi:DNA-binding MarR family transcriptional regulator